MIKFDTKGEPYCGICGKKNMIFPIKGQLACLKCQRLLGA